MKKNKGRRLKINSDNKKSDDNMSTEEIEKELSTLNEEVSNIHKNIEENNKLGEKINKLLERNKEMNKNIKSIFLRLISNSKRMEGITDFQVKYVV